MGNRGPEPVFDCVPPTVFGPRVTFKQRLFAGLVRIWDKG